MDAIRFVISAGGVRAGPFGDYTMPQIINAYHEESLARQRENVVAVARKRLQEEKEALQGVTKRLDDEFSEEVVRKTLEHKRKMNRAKVNGVAWIPGNNPPYRKNSKRDGLPGDLLRADRLEQAIIKLHGSNRAGSLSRILGSNIPRKARRPNALLVVVIGGCIVDPDAVDWLGDITPLADTPWYSDLTVSPWIKGREDVSKRYGPIAMMLVLAAFKVLRWDVEIDPGYKILTETFLRFITGTPKTPSKPPLQIPTPPGKAHQDVEVKTDVDSQKPRQSSNTDAKALQATGKLPKLKKHDKQAWQLSILDGMTQEKVADMLNSEHGETYRQGQISRMIARAKKHAEASKLSDLIPETPKPATSFDPAVMDMGKRTDGLTKSQRLKPAKDRY